MVKYHYVLDANWSWQENLQRRCQETIIQAFSGDIAQLVERTDRTREARGSNPLISKIFPN